MKKVEELREYYEKELLPELSGLESRRKKIMLGVIAASAGGFLVMISPLLLFLIGTTFFPDQAILCCCLGMIPFLAGVAIMGGAYPMMTKAYVRDFKANVMQKVVKSIDPGLDYDPKRTVPLSTYDESRIFAAHVDRYHGEDYIWGTVGATKVEFSEILSEYKTETTDSKGHHHTEWHTIFRGIFFVADFNKEFKGLTLVLPDTAQKMFGDMLGQFLQSHTISRPDLVKLEDPEFEKLFVVYGNDQVEARYILSTSLMARMTDFRKKTARSVYFSFVGSKIMVAIPFNENLFEPRVFRSVVDYQQIEKYYGALLLAVGIVEDLNLNTRIWGKK